MSAMYWIDIVMLIVFIALMVHGAVTGLVKSLFDLAGIIAGYLLAVNFHGILNIPKYIAIAIIFVATVIAVSIAGRLLSKFIRHTPLGTFDRIAGGFLGLLKAYVCGFVFLIVLLLLGKYDGVMKQSAFGPWVIRSGVYTSGYILPRKWSDWIKSVAYKKHLVVSARWRWPS
jgi:membrane protein required for colicin V production